MVKIRWSGEKTTTTTIAGAVNSDVLTFLSERDDNYFSKITPSVDSLTWIGTNDLEKSKSDSSITPIGECNYRTRGVQVSLLGTCDAQKKLTSALRNLDISNDDEQDSADYRNLSFTPVITKDCPYNQFDSNSFRYGFKTQNLTTKEVVTQGQEILNFQVYLLLVS